MRLTKKNYARVVVAIYGPFEAPKQEKKLRARSCGACALKMPQIDPVLTIVHSLDYSELPQNGPVSA